MKQSDLTCPKCKAPLSMTKTAEGALWKCETCSGMAANLAVVRKRLSDEIVRQFWLKATTESVPSDRKCPCCAQKLRMFTAGIRLIHLDLCKTCRLMWFDRNELEAFPKAERVPQPDTKQIVPVPVVGFGNVFENEEGGAENIVGLIVEALCILIRLLVLRS